jgi:hypothetical protein
MQIDPFLLHQNEDRGGGVRLSCRADLEERLGVDGERIINARNPVERVVVLVPERHAHGDTRNLELVSQLGYACLEFYLGHRGHATTLTYPTNAGPMCSWS